MAREKKEPRVKRERKGKKESRKKAADEKKAAEKAEALENMSLADRLAEEGIIATCSHNVRGVHKNFKDINVLNFSITYFGKVLMEECDISLNYGRRYGLIGRNGSGKSTFMNVLGARGIPIPESIDIYHLKHEIEASDMTALEAVLSVDEERNKLQAEADELSEQMTDESLSEEDSEAISDRLTDLYERLDDMDAATAEVRARQILSGLTFSDAMMNKKTKEFSGGWRMRIALARALFIQPTLLLLDEPTNHLDMEAVVWLEDYLSKWKKILLMISHSQEFMNEVCTNIIDLTNKKLEYYAGNYDTYVRTKAEKEENQMKRYNWEQDQIKHMKEYIAKFGHGSAKLARQAQSKEKTLAKMVRDGLTEKVEKESTGDFKFPNPEPLPPPVLMFQNVSFGYPNSPVLYSGVEMGLDLDSRVALVGANGTGKTTLLKLITGDLVPIAGNVRPHSKLRIARFSQHFVDVLDLTQSPLEYFRSLFGTKSVEEVRSYLGRYGITGEVQTQIMGQLSDGQKSRVVFAYMAQQNAHMLLLDEPTNHLDVKNVAWLENYLTSLTNVTSIMVSHDSGFLDTVCTNIIHYETRKLKIYKGNLSKFVEQKPEAKAYYELESENVKFTFPEPGFLADIKNKGKPIIRLTNCSYQYPGAPKPSINNISVTCALSSRIAVLGPNGAGKSTLIKMLTGEVEPTSGQVWKHPSMRFAYVAQHAFHHIESHLDETANQYIQWRFQSGEDKELLAKETRKLSKEEKEHYKKPVNWEGEKRVLEEIVSRRKFKKSFEYELKWEKCPVDDNAWVPREKCEKWGWDKLLQIADDREAARANLQARPPTAIAVQKHLDCFGLGAEFGTHSRMRGLSGGQKVKVVLAAAMWLNPHILVLDEPTNYLDRDSLGALASAIKEFNGGVVMITHHNEFSSALTQETWNVEAGFLSIEGQQAEDKTKIEQKDEEEVTDAFGNVTKKKIKRKLTRKEKKAKEKARKEAEARGEYWSDSDEE